MFKKVIKIVLIFVVTMILVVFSFIFYTNTDFYVKNNIELKGVWSKSDAEKMKNAILNDSYLKDLVKTNKGNIFVEKKDCNEHVKCYKLEYKDVYGNLHYNIYEDQNNNLVLVSNGTMG